MRVGYIVPSLDDTTGWGRWTNDFLRHIAAEGVQPVIVAPASSARFLAPHLLGAQAFFILPEPFDYVQSSSGFRLLRNVRTLRASAAHIPALHLVHSLDAHPWGLYGDWLARRFRVPHVLTAHGRYGYIAENRWLDRMLYGRLLTRAGALVAVSDAVGRAIRRTFGRQVSGRLFAIQNPVDANEFLSAGQLPPGVPAQGPVIISVTRFTPVKDIDTAVRAFRIVRRAIPDASFYIIGPGNGPRNAQYLRIKELIEHEKMEGVWIVGRVPKGVLSAFYRRATMLVHTAITLPDDFEASGLILLEAGLFGLPVVATTSGGIPEVVEEGVTGRLVREKDIDGLAATILELLGDPQLRRRLGEGNRRLALERNWSAYCRDQAALYARIAGTVASASG